MTFLVFFSDIPSIRLPKSQASPGTYHTMPIEGSIGDVALKTRLANAPQAAIVSFTGITLPRYL